MTLKLKWPVVAVLMAVVASLALAQTFLGDAFRPGQRAESAFPTVNAVLVGSILYGTDAGQLYMATSTAWQPISMGPQLIKEVYVNVSPFGTADVSPTFGGGVISSNYRMRVDAINYRIRAPGTYDGGTNGITLKVSDGTNYCKCQFNCDIAIGSYRSTCAGIVGNCIFAAGSSLTYSIAGISTDNFPPSAICPTVPDIEGNIAVEGAWLSP